MPPAASNSYSIANISDIDSEMAATLKAAGIRTTSALLEAACDAKGRARLAAKTGIDEKRILRWANMADRMRIRGVGEEFATLLQAAGVDTVRELKYRNPKKLAEAMRADNDKRKLVRVLPSDKAVVRWIEHAKKLPLKISY